MKKGDIIKIGSKFNFSTLPAGTIVKIVEEDCPIRSFLYTILLKVQDEVKVGNNKVVFFNINNGNYWSNSNLDIRSFEIIRYGAK